LFTIEPKVNHGSATGGKTFCVWNPEGTLLATGGLSKVVSLFDRTGEVAEEISIPG
jgi:hypothetical protein